MNIKMITLEHKNLLEKLVLMITVLLAAVSTEAILIGEK